MDSDTTAHPTGRFEIPRTFLRLGLSSFGGPIAHIGYFRREFVDRRRWVDDQRFVGLLALCQFLPGPASSQLGFSLGLLRGGAAGAIAAFVAFTLPSAALMYAFAIAGANYGGAHSAAVLHGLKLMAVAVVADGVLRMVRQLTPDLTRMAIAIAALLLLLTMTSAAIQLLVIVLGAIAGNGFCKSLPIASSPLDAPVGLRTGSVLLITYLLLLGVAFLVCASSAPPSWRAAAGFYQAGALVFGGGHVVLPLLQETIVAPGLVSRDIFLAGYGAAQAVPGPLFSIASFLGANVAGVNSPLLSAALAQVAIMLPGLLLVSGGLPFWQRLRSNPRALGAVAGVNAAVVGMLAAALIDPLWTSTITRLPDALIAGVAFGLLSLTRVPVLAVIAGCVGAALVLH